MATGLGPTKSLPGRSIALGTVLAVLASLFSFFAPAGVASAADVVYNSAADLPPSCSPLDPDYASSQSLCRETLPGSGPQYIGPQYTVASQTYSWEHVGPRDWLLHVDLTLDWADTVLLDPFSGQPNGRISRLDFWSVTSGSREGGHGAFHNAHPDAFATFADLSSYDGPVAGTNQQETFQHCANHVVCHLTFNDPPLFMPGTAYWLPIAVAGYQAHVVGQSPENPSWDPSYSPYDLWSNPFSGPRHASTYLRLVEHPSDATGINSLSSAIVVTRPDGTAYVQGSARAGDQLVAHVTLSNAAGSPAVTGLTRDDALSSFTSAAVLDAPGPLDTTTLAPGAATTYDVPLTARSGRTTLHVAAHGDNPSRQETSTDELLVMGSPLSVSYRLQSGGIDLSTVTPVNTLTLPDSDSGEIPVDVLVSETIVNRSGGPVDSVTPQPLDLLTVDPRANHLPFPVTVTSGPTFPTGFDHTLAVGASVVVSWTLHVVRNIDLRVRDIVLSHSDGGPPNDVSIGEEVLHARPAHELLLKVVNDDGTALVKTGHPFTLSGTVTNLDQSRALTLDPVLPEFAGNAGGQAALSDGTPTNDGFVPPVAGMLDPGETKHFTVTVQTIPNAGTRGIVTWSPTGSIINSDETKTALTPADLRLTNGTTPMTLHLDDSDPAPIPSTFTERSWVFSATALETMRDWCGNGFNSLTDWRGGLTTLGGALVATGGVVVRTGRAYGIGVNFVTSEVMLIQYWYTLSPAQKEAFAEDIATDLAATNESWKQFHDAIAGVDGAVFTYFAKSQNALQRGDLVELARIRGERFGTALPETLALFGPAVVLNKVARGLRWGSMAVGGITNTSVAEALSLGEKLSSTGFVLKASKGIKGVVAGSDLLADGAKVLRTQFGMARRDISALSYWAERNNLLIAVRQRSELTVNWLKKHAVLKPELVKIKNVDDIDARYLGYLASDEGSVVLREPIDKRLFEAQVRSAPPELRKAIAKRYGVRAKEWRDYEKQYKGWSGKVVDLGFDEAAQGIPGPRRAKLRKFELARQDVHGTKNYFRVMISDDLGLLRRVTGDIDVVAITLADGRVPSAEVRSQLYQDLMGAIGMQHGETLSWILKGELLSAKKASLLADHLPGRELLAIFGHDGSCRAGFFDPQLTIFNQATGETRATFIGAYSTPLERATRYAGVSLARFFQ